jgi:hypothetical protein
MKFKAGDRNLNFVFLQEIKTGLICLDTEVVEVVEKGSVLVFSAVIERYS